MAPPRARVASTNRVDESPGSPETPEATMETDTDWMAQGNCRHEPPTRFFPSDGVGVEVAKKICSTCPVTDLCLEYALEQRIDHGVWGGTSERQRRRILRARRTPVEIRAEAS